MRETLEGGGRRARERCVRGRAGLLAGGLRGLRATRVCCERHGELRRHAHVPQATHEHAETPFFLSCSNKRQERAGRHEGTQHCGREQYTRANTEPGKLILLHKGVRALGLDRGELVLRTTGLRSVRAENKNSSRRPFLAAVPAATPVLELATAGTRR